MLLKFSVFAILSTIIHVVPAGADNTGYGFVYAFSYQLKEAYVSPILPLPVKGKSLNAQEYVADIKVIRKLEDTLEQHLLTKLHLNTALFSFTARTGYKSDQIAKSRMEDERTNLRVQGLEMKLLPDFAYTP